MMLLHPNLVKNARIVFKLCSLLITKLTIMHQKHDTYMNILNHVFNSD